VRCRGSRLVAVERRNGAFAGDEDAIDGVRERPFQPQRAQQLRVGREDHPEHLDGAREDGDQAVIDGDADHDTAEEQGHVVRIPGGVARTGRLFVPGDAALRESIIPIWAFHAQW